MRLIDADKFILALMDASLSSVDEDTILDLVDSVPIVDVAPVVHGRWIYDKKAQRPYKAAGLHEEEQAVNIRMQRLNAKYKAFSAAAGLPEQRERMKVLY